MLVVNPLPHFQCCLPHQKGSNVVTATTLPLKMNEKERVGLWLSLMCLHHRRRLARPKEIKHDDLAL